MDWRINKPLGFGKMDISIIVVVIVVFIEAFTKSIFQISLLLVSSGGGGVGISCKGNVLMVIFRYSCLNVTVMGMVGWIYCYRLFVVVVACGTNLRNKKKIVTDTRPSYHWLTCWYLDIISKRRAGVWTKCLGKRDEWEEIRNGRRKKEKEKRRLWLPKYILYERKLKI